MATKATRAQGPHIPPPYTLADASAMQALEQGNASSEQQKRALKWLIETCSGTYEFNFYTTDRDTSFALGRTFVGQQTVKLLRINLAALQQAT